MIGALKPYSEYKESGMPWVGLMPSHWQQRRAKALFRERAQKGFPNEPLLAATQTKGVVRKKDYGSRTVTAQKDLHLLKLVEADDFVISLRSFEGGIEVAHCRGIISPAYTVLEPRMEARRGFYANFFKSPDFIRSLTLFVTGIREGQNIDYERMSRAYMPAPPVDEQQAIGRFLDHVNRRIDRFIRTKKKLIKLLHEQKQAIIHRAVTCGLHPAVRLKTCAAPWLENMPGHWGLVPLKRLLTRMDYGTSEPGSDTGTIRVLAMGNIREGEIVIPELGSLDFVPEELILHADDLLFNRTNSPELVGKVGIFRGAACDRISFASYLVRLRTKKGINPRWLNFLLNSPCFWSFARSLALVSLHQANLNSTRYGQMLLPVPPEPEQFQIADFIEQRTKIFRDAQAKAQHEIELLRELRTCLIADVVTGKLDVREAAAKLPAQVDAGSAEEPAELLDLDQEETGDEETEAVSEEADA